MNRVHLKYLGFVLVLFFTSNKSNCQSNDEQINAGSPKSIPGAMNTGTVDMASGKVSFSEPLAHLPGRNGLGVDLVARYNSTGIDKIVGTWNMDAPTGALGLGWSLPVNKIIRDIKASGTPMDDTYSLLHDGTMTALVLTNADDGSGNQVYQAKGVYHNWDIRYHSPTEKWTLIADNGMTYVYGDGVTKANNGQPNFYTSTECASNSNKCGFPKSDGNSIEWMVTWGNWVGPSVNVSGQGNMAVAWNLSKVENIWKEAVNYEYEQITQYVGGVGDSRKKYTQESYLKGVTNADNQSLILNYAQKAVYEYQDPHSPGDTNFGLTMSAPNWNDGKFGGEADPIPHVQIGTLNNPSQYYDHTFREYTDQDHITIESDTFSIPKNIPSVVIHITIYNKNNRPFPDDPMIIYTDTLQINSDSITTIPEVTQSSRYGTAHMNFSLNQSHSAPLPDAYQERYETQYLQSIQLTNQANVILYEVDFGYELLGTVNAFKKRTLQSITHKVLSNTGSSLLNKVKPNLKFSYWGSGDGVNGVTVDSNGTYEYDIFDHSTHALYGALKTVTLPEGGSDTYKYSKNQIPMGQRQSPEITPPDSTYTDIKSFFGPGFTVFTWKGTGTNANTLAAQIWMWDGHWKKQEFTIDSVSSGSYDSLDMVSGDQYFILATPHKTTTDNNSSSLHSFYFEPNTRNWTTADINLKLTGRFNISGGTNFFSVIDQTNGHLSRYQLGTNNRFNLIEGVISLPTPTNAQYTLTTGPNYIFSYTGSDTPATRHPQHAATSSANVRLDYRDLSGNWHYQTKTFPLKYWGMVPFHSTYDSLPLILHKPVASTGDNFIAVKGYHVLDSDILYQTNFGYIIFTLPDDLSQFSSHVSIETYNEIYSGSDSATGRLDSEAGGLFVTNDAVYFSASSQSTRNKASAHHFNGHKWIQHDIDNNYRNGFYSDNLMPISIKDDNPSRKTTLNSSFRSYDPNSEEISESFAPSQQVLLSVWKKYVHYALETLTFVTMAVPVFAEVGIMFNALDIALNVADIGFNIFLEMSLKQAELSDGGSNSRYLFSGSSIFFRNHDETWTSIGVLDNADKTKPSISDDVFSYKGNHNKLYAQFVKNGQKFGTKQVLQNAGDFGANDKSLGNGPGVIITRNPVHLYKVMQDGANGLLSDYVVSQVSTHDGYLSYDLNYSYDASTAAVDAGGTTAIYNKVTTTSDISSSTDGRTEYYFLNGNIATTTPNITDSTVQLKVSTLVSSQTYTNLSCVTKLPYYTGIYDYSGTLVSSLRNYYEVVEKSISGTMGNSKSYLINEVRTVNMLDGSTIMSEAKYDSYGRLTKHYTTNYAPNGNTEITESATTYAVDDATNGTAYTGMNTAHMMDASIQEITTLYSGSNITPSSLGNNKTQVSNIATTWKNWGSPSTPKWAPEKTYTALNNSPGTFTFTSTGGGLPTTASNWIKELETTNIETSNGVITEIVNANSIHVSTIYDSLYRYGLADFTHASVAGNIAGYYGFEPYEIHSRWQKVGNESSNAHTGIKGLSGTNASVKPVSFSAQGRQMIVSAWVKPNTNCTCTVGFQNSSGEWVSNQYNSTSDSTKWNYLETVISTVGANTKPVVKCTGGSIDDFRFSPVDAPFHATVYDTTLYQPIATMGTNGDVIRTEYDSLRRPSRVTGPKPGNQTNFNYYFSRNGSDNNDTFSSSDPNWVQINRGVNNSRQSRHYTDGLGRTIQSQSLKEAGKVITSATIYDGWGNIAAITKPTEKTSPLGYISNFSSLDWLDGTMTGEVADYYHTGNGKATADSTDYQYPYTRIIYERSPLSRISKIALPGYLFSYKQPVTTTPDPSTAPDYTIHREYGSTNSQVNLNNVEEELFALSGITWNSANQKKYFGEKSSKPINDSLRRATIALKDLEGKMLAWQKGDTSLNVRNSLTYAHEMASGSTNTQRYFPMAHSSPNTRNEHYFSTAEVDYRGHILQSSTPDSDTTRRLYDTMGRLRFEMDAEGASKTPTNQVKYWKYDSLNRILEAGYLNQIWSGIAVHLENASWPATPATWRYQYTYDMDSSSNTTNLKGRLWRVEINSDDDASTEVINTYAYDVAGQTIEHNQTVYDYDSTARTTVYAYNDFDELSQIIYPASVISHEILTPQESLLSGSREYEASQFYFQVGYGIASNAEASHSIVASDTIQCTVTYSYDLLGQVVNVGDVNDADRYASYTYNADGTIATETTNSAHTPTIRTYNYNFLGQPTGFEEKIGNNLFFSESLRYTKPHISGTHTTQVYQDGNVQSAHYAIDTTKAQQASANGFDYTYDALGRLTQAQNDSIDFSALVHYDANGNISRFNRRLSLNGDYSYYNNTNRLKSIHGISGNFTYNQNGAMVGTPTIASISYDPYTNLPNQIAKNGDTTQIQYGNGNYRVLKKNQGNKKLYLRGISSHPLLEISSHLMYYIYGPSGLIAMHDDSEEYFVTKDYLGSTRVVRDTLNNIQGYFSYMPFGGTYEEFGANKDLFTYRYTGQEYDEDLEIYNYNARLYDQYIGRFYETDPAGQYTTPYAYVGNNPINYSDPSGEVKFQETWDFVKNREATNFNNYLHNVSLQFQGEDFETLMSGKMTEARKVEVTRRFDDRSAAGIADVQKGIKQAKLSSTKWEKFKDRFRPGGMHEMLAVSMIEETHKAGFKMADIQGWVIATTKTSFQKRVGSGFGKTEYGHNTDKSEAAHAHIEIFDVIKKGKTKTGITNSLKKWQLGQAIKAKNGTSTAKRKYRLSAKSRDLLPVKFR